MMNRRRFLAISAAALATPAYAQPTRWQGHAMGAEVSLTLDADPQTAASAIARLRAILADCEALFSLYRPDSALSRLNRVGHLEDPDPTFVSLLRTCDQAHSMTEGRFDPTVQPLWTAATPTDVTRARELVGWRRVRVSPARVQLDPGQALTLNGIAQGFATDLVAASLRQAGFTRILVNIGEFHAGGRVWTLGISDPQHGLVDTIRLKDRAVATSSPGALRLRSGEAHILDPIGERSPLWSTISVQAPDATTADALSTALCYANEVEIAAILSRTAGDITAVCVRPDGSLTTLRG